MTIYKLKLIFKYPLALPQAPRLARVELAAFHAILAFGFLLDPYKVIGMSVLALFLLLFRNLKRSPYLAENIMFAQQRILTAVGFTAIFLALYANKHVNAEVWGLMSKAMAGLYLYDAYLAFNGITGLFFVNYRKILKK